MEPTPSSVPRPRRLWRTLLGVLHLVVALTAVAGGLTLIVGTLIGDTSGVLVPSADYLAGSIFPDYLVPGVLLAAVVGGTQVLAGILTLRDRGGWPIGSAVASFGLAIWVFVQMTIIPFSFLQAVYFAFALGEIGLLLAAYGILSRPRP